MRIIPWLLACCALITACANPAGTATAFPSYDPFLPVEGTSAFEPAGLTSPEPPTPTRGPTPTRAPVSITLPPTPNIEQPLVSPTPDALRVLPTPRQDLDQYVVQPGDSLGSIAQQYGVSVEAILQANDLPDPNVLDVGLTLNIPAPIPDTTGPWFKVIPDSELVYGPASVYFNTYEFIQGQAGYLAGYTEEVKGELLPADEIITRVAQNYSINPRLLLALLEYQSGWVTNPAPMNTGYPMGLLDDNHQGLYLQLTWAADTLNRGYSLWRVNAVATWVLNDGTVVPVDPTINAGTAGVQNFFSKLDDRPTWENDISGTGLFLTYFVFFGNPFNLAIEPLLPADLSQPLLDLPIPLGETWSFTGGPHGGWDSGSAWAALDFAPPGEAAGCAPSDSWVTAVADGLVLRAADGAVIQDLDNDGYEQTGWVILYMHIESVGRIEPLNYLFAGERIGHPSCEGGIANGTHVHLARRFNGEWIAADGAFPFNLSGWISSGDGIEYDGYLTRGSQKVEAWDGVNDLNQITH